MDSNAISPPDAVETDSGLLSLILLARFLGVAANPAQLRHQLAMRGCVFDTASILRAAKHLKLKARALTVTIGKLSEMPLPAIACARDGGYFVVIRSRDDRFSIQHPDRPAIEHLDAGAMERQWTGGLVLLTRRLTWPAADERFGWRWFVPAIVRYRALFSEVLLASFFIQLFALATPLFFQVVVDKVLVHGSLTTLEVLAIGLMAVSVFDVVLGALRNYLLAHTSSRIDVQLGARLFKHLLSLPLGYFESRRVGHTVARVRELESLRDFITGSTVTLVMDLLFTFLFFIVLFHYSVSLAWIVLASVPAYIVLSVAVTPVLRCRLNEKFDRGAENQAFLVESVTGVQTLKAVALEPQAQRRWEDQLATYVKASFRANNLGNIAGQISNLISKLTTLAILWLGAKLVIGGALTVGQLVAFNMIASRISGPILKLVSLWQQYQQAGISLRRLGDILNAPIEAGHDGNKTSPQVVAGRIEFEHVSFRYRPDRPEALSDIELRIEPGRVVGIVGRSGSGKSTLTRLVQRLYVPERGRVLIDGMDMAVLDPAWLRRQIGVVLQESFLFNRSVRDNIALADPGLPIESIIRTARLSGAHDFILDLPEGYDTMVEEQGANLSGGQRQRIAIARALISNPKILIFDEATSALDYESERIIHDNMRSICVNRTVLIIAHRLSAVRHADEIVVIDRGRIVERGEHDELVGGDGHYASLHKHQSGLHLVPHDSAI